MFPRKAAPEIISDDIGSKERGTELTLTLLSVVIPARNEERCIISTVKHLHVELQLHRIPHEIIVVDDASVDATSAKLDAIRSEMPELVVVKNPGPHGFGRAVTRGIDRMKGDAVVIMMADESDDCRDVVRYWTLLQQGYECVFGSRFLRGGGTIDYPRLKLLWADNKYNNKKLQRWLEQQNVGYIIDVVSRPLGAKGFVLLHRRWVVERTIAWLGRYRRLSKDYEYYPASSEAQVQISSIHLMLRRLRPNKDSQSPPFKYPKKVTKAV